MMGNSRDALSGGVFVGRKAERERLRIGLEEALAGRPGLFLISGEPGIGKTALCEQLAREASARSASVLWGRCWEGEGAPPYWPWTQALRDWAKETPREGWKRHLARGAGLVRQIVPELGEIGGGEHAPSAGDSEAARFQLFDAVTSFFLSASRERPLVLLLEDLHWADRSSLLLLQFFVRELREVPILVAATYREVAAEGDPHFADAIGRLRQERIATRVELRGLSEDDVRGMLEALNEEPVPAEFARALTRETEGNPFFVEEMLRHLIDEEILVRDGGRWMSRLAAGQIPLPESLRDVIARRLERLGTRCREILRTAAVIGREYSLDVLGRVVSLSPGDLLDALDPADAAGLVREVAIGRFIFSHGLVRETLYQELRTLERVRLHRAVGDALEGVYAADPEPHLSELAHHFLESAPAGGGDRAFDYALRAARRARDHLAWEEALGFYRRALAVSEHEASLEDRLRCTVLLELGEVIQDASGHPAARETFLEAARLAERLGAPDLFARAALGVAGSQTEFEVYANAVQVEMLEKALGRLGREDSALRATVTGQLAAALTFSGERERKVALADEAVAMARRVGDRRALAHILFVTQMPTWSPDNLAERLERAREEARLAQELGESRLEALSWSVSVAHLVEAGDVDAVRRQRNVRKRVVRAAMGRAMANVVEAMLALFEGRYDEVEPLIEDALALSPSPESTGIANSCNAQLLFLRREQDRLDEIVDVVRAVLDQYPKIIAWRGGLAWALAELGRYDEARTELDAFAFDGFSRVPREMLWVATMWQLAEVAVALGDRARCETLYGLLSPFADRCITVGQAVCAGSVARPLGELAATIGRHDEAEQHFLRALEADSRLGARPWVAWAQLGYARLLRARGDAGDARRAAGLLEEARATAQALGMKALERRIAASTPAAGPEDRAAAPSAREAVPATGGPVRSPGGLSRDGDRWILEWAGATYRFRHTKGFTYLAYLLARPNEEMHAIDLLAACGEWPAPDGDGSLERLRALRAQLAEAEAHQDAGRIEGLSREIARRVEETTAQRKGPEAERARLAVTKPVKTAIRKIRGNDEALGRHLETSVRTGYICAYFPDPGTPAWRISS